MNQTANRPTSESPVRTDHDAIGEGLRRLFLDVVNEPIPAEFLELLGRAEAPRTPRAPDKDDAA
jgi:hypothetical protein